MGFDCSWELSMEVLRCPILSPLLLVFVFALFFRNPLAFDDLLLVEEGFQSNEFWISGVFNEGGELIFFSVHYLFNALKTSSSSSTWDIEPVHICLGMVGS